MCRERFKWSYVATCSVFIAFSGNLNGYDVGSSNGVKEMKGFREYFNLSETEGNTTCKADNDEGSNVLLGLVVSLFSLGSLFGALLGGPLSDWAGRRAALLTGALLCASGIIVQTSSVFIWMLLIAKFWAGLGNGMLTQVGVLYVAELSPKHLRGKLVGMVPTSATTGVLTAALVNLCVEGLPFGWRVSLGLQFIFSGVLIIGSPLIPESPRWLVKRNKSNKAMKVLKRIYKDEATVSSCLEEMSEFSPSSHNLGLCKTFCTRDNIIRIFLGFSILLFARVNGMQLVLYFSASMFCKVGVSGFVGGVLIGVAVLAGQIFQLFIADKFGRKLILLCGYLVMTVCLVAASILILVFDLESDTLSTENTVAGYFVMVFLMLFVGIGMMSSVSQAWILVSEISPLRTKGVAVAVSSVGWWGGNVISGELSPFLLTSLGTAGTLLLHSGICVLVLFFVLLLLPETKNLSLEQADKLFSVPWKQRVNVLYYLTCGRINRVREVAFSRLEDMEPLSADTISLNQMGDLNDDNISATEHCPMECETPADNLSTI